MKGVKERFTIRITSEGLAILGSDGAEMQFTPLEALMLLDILRHEENTLRQSADEASPPPWRLRAGKAPDPSHKPGSDDYSISPS